MEKNGRLISDVITESLVEKLIDRRYELGLTQKQLARKMDISPSYLSDLETGKTSNPTLYTLLAWLQSLKIDESIIIQGIVVYKYEEETKNV